MIKFIIFDWDDVFTLSPLKAVGVTTPEAKELRFMKETWSLGHKERLQEILEDVGIKPQETVVLGDSKSDAQMSRNAEIEPVVLLTGFLTREEAEGLGVKHVIDDITIVEPKLIRLGSKTPVLA
jgi:phosphoglycolate phosphatase-like HAD superfamily hydrolase